MEIGVREWLQMEEYDWCSDGNLACVVSRKDKSTAVLGDLCVCGGGDS